MISDITVSETLSAVTMPSNRGMYTEPAPLGATHVALCIGNSKYASSPLQNAVNDAQDMAALCTNLGFATEAGVTW